MKDLKLKQFIEDNFDFASLKQAGFFPKGTRKTDYEKIAARICQWFGYQSIYEYKPIELIVHPNNIATGSTPGEINKEGEYVEGASFLLHTVQSTFACPICTCEQDANDHTAYRNSKNPYCRVTCKGCKRKLSIVTGLSGDITVEEC